MFFYWIAASFPNSALPQVSPNQHEMMRQHGLDCNQRYDGCRSNTTTPPDRPNEVWKNKYGAIAFDSKTSSVWASENQPSLRAARRDALRKCADRSCEIVASVVNGCLAAGDSGGYTYFGAGESEDLAIQKVNSRCAARGATCTIGYVHCNVPVRIR